MCFCFLFKQKTAYEMRISDWSSDVCSSDLWFRRCRPQPLSRRRPYRRGPHLEARPVTRPSALPPSTTAASLAGVAPGFFARRGDVSARELASPPRGLGAADAPALIAENPRRALDAVLPGARLAGRAVVGCVRKKWARTSQS